MANVLVIEDNPANMTLAVFLLESAGHTVAKAVNAEEGLMLARAERPDLILMSKPLSYRSFLATIASEFAPA